MTQNDGDRERRDLLSQYWIHTYYMSSSFRHRPRDEYFHFRFIWKQKRNKICSGRVWGGVTKLWEFITVSALVDHELWWEEMQKQGEKDLS